MAMVARGRTVKITERYTTLFIGLVLAGCLSSCLRNDENVVTTPEYEPPLITKFPGPQVSWAEAIPIATTLYESQGLVASGRFYIFGGYYNDQIQSSPSTYAFDPARERWYNLAPMPEEITHAGQALYGDKVYLTGGFLGDHPGPPTDHVWVYDLSEDTWTAGPPLPERLGGGALVELGGRLHFFGGTVRDGGNYLYDSPRHWVLDVSAGATVWAEAAPMPEPRNHLGGVALGGKIYAIGGQRLGDEASGNQRYVHAYDPGSDIWQRLADLPKPLGHITSATFAYGGQIFVVGGVTQGLAKESAVIVYDPASDAWGRVRGMPGARSSTVAGLIAGEIVLSTGYVGGQPLDTTWIGQWTEP